VEKRQALQQMMLRKADIHLETETRTLNLKELNVKTKTLKPLEESIWKTFQDTGMGNVFQNRTQ
jgi:hypothetical protein